MFPVGSIVIHKTKPEFGYGIIVDSMMATVDVYAVEESSIAIVLWHGNEKHELTQVPQIHEYSELKVLSTEVGFA